MPEKLSSRRGPLTPDRSQSGSGPGAGGSGAAPLPWPDDDAELLPFLPMLYVAWADGALSPEEMEAVCGLVRTSEELAPESVRILESWLRPGAPPPAAALAQLRERIRDAAERVPADEVGSLARLGASMARVHGRGAARWGTAAGLRTLESVEDLLGVLGREAARELLADEAKEAAPAPAEAPTWEPELGQVLEGRHREERRKVLELLRDPRIRVPDGLPTPEHRRLVLEAVRRLADEGLGALGFPEEHGGRGDVAAAVAAFETLAYGNLSVLVKYGVQFGLFGGSILQLGSERHHREYLGPVGRLELPGIFAMTERGWGSNVRELQTRARYLPETDELEVHTPHPGAVKDWLGNAALHGRMATVFAGLEVDGEEHGVHAVLVRVRDDRGRPLPGIRIEDCGEKVGLHGVDNGRIAFDRVRVPRENLLDRFGRITPEGRYTSPIASPGQRFFTMLGTLVAGRISIAAASVSAAKTGLAIAVPYSARRRQFGPAGGPQVPVLDYRSQQRALFPPLAATYALHFAVRSLVAEYAGAMGEDESRHRVEVLAAGLKALASRHAVDTLQACREAMGGQGYLAANRLGYLREDADVFTTFEGANVVLLLLVSRGLLSRYRDEVGDLRLWDTVRLLAERAGSEAQRRNPVRSRRTGEAHLRDPEVQAEAFRFREQRLLGTVARRLKNRIDQGMDSFDAMNECQDHLTALARAHMERIVLERFREAIAELRNGRAGPAGPDGGTTPEEEEEEEEGEGESASAAKDEDGAPAEAPAPDQDRSPAKAPASAVEALELLADLYALSRLEADRGWFLESGYMEARQTRAIRDLVNRLCDRVRPVAVPLVRAFGIPDEVLGAPGAFHAPDGP